MIRVAISLLVFLASAARAVVPSDATALQLAVGESETLKLPHLARAAVGDRKIARLRPVPPDALLITAIHPGETTVRAWSESGEERVIELSIVAADLSSAVNEEATVKVALEFLELDLAIARHVGVQWPEAVQFASNATWQGASSMSGINYVVTFNSTQGWIHHLVREGWGKVLAHPDLYVRLGEQATFHSGGEVPITTAVSNYGNSFQHVEWKPFGLSVKVKPRSADGLHLRSDIEVEISELNRGGAVEGIPALNKRELKTKIDSLDGETVLLSGLVRQAAAENRQSVPLLSSIPLLGALFSDKSREHEESEILMAVTFSLATRTRERLDLERRRDRILKSEGLP